MGLEGSLWWRASDESPWLLGQQKGLDKDCPSVWPLLTTLYPLRVHPIQLIQTFASSSSPRSCATAAYERGTTSVAFSQGAWFAEGTRTRRLSVRWPMLTCLCAYALRPKSNLTWLAAWLSIGTARPCPYREQGTGEDQNLSFLCIAERASGILKQSTSE